MAGWNREGNSGLVEQVKQESPKSSSSSWIVSGAGRASTRHFSRSTEQAVKEAGPVDRGGEDDQAGTGDYSTDFEGLEH